jgi:hypothetical protein
MTGGRSCGVARSHAWSSNGPHLDRRRAEPARSSKPQAWALAGSSYSDANR